MKCIYSNWVVNILFIKTVEQRKIHIMVFLEIFFLSLIVPCIGKLNLFLFVFFISFFLSF